MTGAKLVDSLSDAVARRKIVEELDKTLFVEAGAGSGKTKSLVDRMIALLSAGRCVIGTLAAVTFTRKAAAELRGRFQIELERKVASETKPEIKTRLESALQNLEQCYIGTIHSFCAKLLRERPIEIGLDPDFVEMEEIEDQVFREKCWNDYMVKVRLEQEDIVAELEDVGLAPEDLKDAFVMVALYPEVEVIGGSTNIPDFPKFRNELEEFLDRARRLMPEEKPEKGYDGLQKLLVRCFGRRDKLGYDDDRCLMETLEFLDKEPGITLNRWRDKECAETARREFAAIREGMISRALREWREYRHDKIVRFLRPAIQFYEEQRKRENKLNFEDLLMQARRLLRDNPEVRGYFSRKFTHMLVDELQDTDPIQAEVLLYLKGEDQEERDWQKQRIAPGSLFLVGDPRQSIYRFRRADIDTYNLLKKITVESGGEVLSLTSNFRSLRALGEWNNPIFRKAFPPEATRHQAAFAPLETVREEEAGTKCGVYKLTMPKVERDKGEEIASADAASIAEWIFEACDKGNLRLSRSKDEREKGQGQAAQPRDFMILYRYKKHMSLYARELEKRDIPFEITGSDAFAESEEIGEVKNLAIALNDPDNPIYTVAVLRGIFFGSSDNDLMAFRREGGRFNFMAAARDIVASKTLGATLVGISMAKMRDWRGWTLKMPPSAALEKIFEESGILNYLAAKEMGSSRVGNMLKLLELLRNEERKGATLFSGAVDFLKQLAEVGDIEEISLTPGRENAVRLMNLHKAKGLEAPVVFLANPAGIKDHPVEKHVVRIEDASKSGTPRAGAGGGGRGYGRTNGISDGRPKGWFVFSKPSGIYQRAILSQPWGWEDKAAEEKRYREAEEQRLMYVASTRARNMLVISAYAQELKNKAWATLDDALKDVPELEVGGGGSERTAKERENGRSIIATGASSDIAPGRREKIVITKAEVERARKEIAENIALAGKPSYLVETVTSVAIKDQELPSWQRASSGSGLSWGRIVHQALEAVGTGNVSFPLDLYIENLLAAEERDPADKEKLLALVDSITRSEFWQRVMRAKRRYFEIPFSIKTTESALKTSGTSIKKGKEIKSDDTPSNVVDIPVILTGTIDLVFWEEDGGVGNDGGVLKGGKLGKEGEEKKDAGWVIADYKTDIIPGSEKIIKYESPRISRENMMKLSYELAQIIDFYAPQVRLYTKFWSQITGERVKESGLYFTSLNRWINIFDWMK